MIVAHASKELCLFALFEKFIADSTSGRRLQPNGNKISSGTIENYTYVLKLIKRFSEVEKMKLRVRLLRHLNKKEFGVEQNYWKKFYKRFCDFLYIKCGYYDNYIGQVIKNIKVFFNYLNKELLLGIGDFYKMFHVRKEAIRIFPLMPEQLHYLIYDEAFERSLSKRMQEIKDVFVFGCTVALRVSDLRALKKTNLVQMNSQTYLSVCSQKTKTEIYIRLPDYALAIIEKYKKIPKVLLPAFNKSNLNRYIKKLLEFAGFTQEVSITRNRLGKPSRIKNTQLGKFKAIRFCDVASSHTMRRTAITTMLCLGMPEQVVRKISGHAPHTKEFYRYMVLAQAYQDEETTKTFDKLKKVGNDFYIV